MDIQTATTAWNLAHDRFEEQHGREADVESDADRAALNVLLAAANRDLFFDSVVSVLISETIAKVEEQHVRPLTAAEMEMAADVIRGRRSEIERELRERFGL